MLKTRVVTAFLLLAVIVPALIWLPPRGWAVFVLMFVGAAAWEWGRLAGLPGHGPLALAMVVSMSGLSMLAWASPPILALTVTLLSMATLLWLAVVPYWLRARAMAPSGLRLATAGWFMLLACWYSVWIARESGAVYLFLLIGVVWVADIAAYFCGKAFGRHKLAPSISPGKTWEGVAGAVGAVQILAVICVLAQVRAPNYFGEVFGALGWAGVVLVAFLLTGVSVIGDLFESLLKRRADVKDSSNLLPGHGGVLDRIDAILPTLPVAVCISTLLALRGAP